jgi:aryl-alcohol dehydrogenase-like predicted oxidoreductase
MIFSKINSLQRPMPKIIYGCGALNASVRFGLIPNRSLKQFFDLLDAAWDAGCIAFDTAAVYPGSENILGKWLKRRGRSGQAVIITKGGFPCLKTGRSRLNRKELTADIHRSLRQLRVDRLDLYFLHRDDPSADFEEITSVLESFRTKGMIGVYGASNWTHPRVAEFNSKAISHGGMGFAVSSPQFSLIGWKNPPWPGCVSISGREGGAARNWYAQNKLPVLAWSPLSGGMLANTPRIDQNSVYRTDQNIKRIEKAKLVAQRRGIGLSQLALSYLFSLSPLDVFAVIGTHNAKHLVQLVQAVEIRLSAEEIQELEAS